ncbi:helix-turn-helix domain-containing protein [Chloroflexota bacterium]
MHLFCLVSVENETPPDIGPGMPFNVGVDILLIDGLTGGRRIRLARVAKGWRKIDLAAHAGVPATAVCDAELDRTIARWNLRRILAALGLEANP